MFIIEKTIGPELIAPRYEHLHHADALRLLEEARCSYLTHIGYPLELLMDDGLFLVVTALNVRYLREIQLGNYSVTCEGQRVDGKRMIVDQRILNAKGKDCITATVECMALSAPLKRSVAVPEGLARAFGGQATANPPKLTE